MVQGQRHVVQGQGLGPRGQELSSRTTTLLKTSTNVTAFVLIHTNKFTLGMAALSYGGMNHFTSS